MAELFPEHNAVVAAMEAAGDEITGEDYILWAFLGYGKCLTDDRHVSETWDKEMG